MLLGVFGLARLKSLSRGGLGNHLPATQANDWRALGESNPSCKNENLES